MSIFLVQSVVDAVVGRGPLWDGLGYLVTVMLLLLLVQKELVRAYTGSQHEKWTRALDLAIWPFGLAFTIVVLVHLIDILSRR